MTNQAHFGAALDRTLDALSRCAPDAAQRANAALEVCLSGVRSSRWPEVAWAFSGLNGDGFPVEITFSSLGANDVRYAAEVAGPEELQPRRIRRAFEVYKTLTGREASPAVECAFIEMQRGRHLDYGAWFGGAHGPGGDRYKIYTEIPCSCDLDRVFPDLFAEGQPLPQCRSRPVMFGFQPDRELREVYFGARCLTEPDLGRLLWNCELGHRYCEMLDLICDANGRSGLPPAISGFSIARGPHGRINAISLFAVAWVLFGSDANIRRTLLGLGRRHNWNLNMYEQATEVLQHRDSLVTHHGIVAWIASPDASVELRVGLRPPEQQGSDRSA
jgi:hypothetical protein